MASLSLFTLPRQLFSKMGCSLFDKFLGGALKNSWWAKRAIAQHTQSPVNGLIPRHHTCAHVMAMVIFGSEHILNVAVDDADYEKMHKRVTQALRGHFRPEFLNRIDDLIIFHTLKRDELYQIVGLQIQRLQKLLAQQKITLELSGAAQDYIVNVGYDPVYGARPLKRAIQRELENPIATRLLENTFVEGDTIAIDCVERALTFRKKAPVALLKPQTAV